MISPERHEDEMHKLVLRMKQEQDENAALLQQEIEQYRTAYYDLKGNNTYLLCTQQWWCFSPLKIQRTTGQEAEKAPLARLTHNRFFSPPLCPTQQQMKPRD